ncbi:MAG: L-aspartate oxidase [Flavobacteriales bacterium]
MKPQLDVIVVGGGIAGMACAVQLAEQAAGRPVRMRIIAKEAVSGSNSYAAQGGMAAVLHPADSTASHVRDTLTVGEGRNDPAVARRVVCEGPAVVRALLGMGAAFDTDAAGQLALAREGGHTMARVVHHLDRTGAEIVRVLQQRVRASPCITLIDEQAVDLLVEDDRCIGIRSRDPRDERLTDRFAHAVVLATGGAGQVYLHTTNPPGATGDGIAMAARARVPLRDMAFVQFHPTALYTGATGTAFLISEAVRGAGATLLRPDGRPLMEGVHPQGDLAPRNVVARTIARVMARTRSPHVWLDTAPIGTSRFAREFPAIAAYCRERGIACGRDRIPVMPAAHYLCGGIRTDGSGRSALSGLYALGECAGSGLHGADRLASNSLLEALVLPRHAAKDMLRTTPKHIPSSDRSIEVNAKAGPKAASPAYGEMMDALRRTMTMHAGILRSDHGLHTALRRIERVHMAVERAWMAGDHSSEAIVLRNMVDTARAIVHTALAEPYSVGTHWVSGGRR